MHIREGVITSKDFMSHAQCPSYKIILASNSYHPVNNLSTLWQTGLDSGMHPENVETAGDLVHTNPSPVHTSTVHTNRCTQHQPCIAYDATLSGPVSILTDRWFNGSGRHKCLVFGIIHIDTLYIKHDLYL